MSKEQEELVSLSGSFAWRLTDVKTKLVDRFPEVNTEYSVRVSSPALRSCGYEWKLQVVMSRKVDGGPVTIGAFLRPFHDDKQIDCGAEIWNDKTVLIAWSNHKVTSESWGVSSVWSEQELKKNAAETNEIVLSVQLTVKTDQTKVKEKEVVKPVLNPFPFDEKFSDITIKTIDSVEFKAHKVVLAHRSTVFASLFSWPVKESKEPKEGLISKEGLIDVKETGTIMHALLEFMYSGSLTRTQSLTNITDASRLFEAAIYYDVPEVAIASIPVIEKHLTAVNAWQF